MSDYVLVHGAWHGGWCWEPVARRLRDAGHRVFTPTLTGLGERAHLLTPEVGLRTHVTDILGVLRYEDLHDVVLVGHSYAGLVVRETADQAPHRVGRIVLLDAWVGPDGASMESLAPDWFRNWLDTAADDRVIPVPPVSTLGVTDPRDVAWLQSRMTPQPRRTFAEPTRLAGAVEQIPCRAVLCTPDNGMPFAAWAQEFGWETVTLAAGHDAMVTSPTGLADLLLEEAAHEYPAKADIA